MSKLILFFTFIVVLISSSIVIINIAMHEAQADEEKELVMIAMPNGVNGHVVLTNQPCTANVDLSQSSIKSSQTMQAAFATSHEGTKEEAVLKGCWLVNFPYNDAAPGAIPMVNIYTELGPTFSNPLGDFIPYRSKEVKFK